jgi:hypothetical protein
MPRALLSSALLAACVAAACAEESCAEDAAWAARRKEGFAPLPASDDLTAPTDPSAPLYEPPRTTWFDPLANYEYGAPPLAQKLTRVRDIDPETFNDLSSRGQPFIIEDAARDLPLLGKPCDFYAEHWPNGSMRAEYYDESLTSDEWEIFHCEVRAASAAAPQERCTPSRASQVEHDNKIPLSNKLWWNTPRLANRRKKMETQHMMGEGGALSAPYIWHVKDQARSSARARSRPLLSPSPHTWRGGGPGADPDEALGAAPLGHALLPQSLGAQRDGGATMMLAVRHRSGCSHQLLTLLLPATQASESFEFWFSLVGGGTMAHADAYCEMTLSMQLRGAKRWRLMLLPPIDSADDLFDTHDGRIYATNRWVPEYEVTVQEGEAIVFPPNYMHETYVHPDDNRLADCTVGTTFQFRYPHAARYLRAFFPRFAMSHLQDDDQCASRQWAWLATMRERPSLKQLSKDMGGYVAEIFAAADADADGLIGEAELAAWLRTAPEHRWAREVHAESRGHFGGSVSAAEEAVMAEETVLGTAKAMVEFQDADADGAISGDELRATLARWLASLKRYVKEYRKLRKTGGPR